MFTRTALAALAAACLPAPALAQAPIATRAEPDEAGATAIIVTGTRAGRPLRPDQIGGSVTVLDPDALDRRQVREVSDILRDVPGVAVGRVAGQTQVRLRGAEGNHTLVLVDGIEVSDAFAGEFDFGTLVADDAARIEVLRGHQSAIYGSDAIGGVIHYRTASGRDAPGVRARLEGGSFGTVNSAARFAGEAGALDYALSGTFNSTEGTPNARGGRRDLANDTGAAALKLGWLPAGNARAHAVVRYARTEADFNDSDFDSTSPSFGLIIDSPGTRFENEAFYGLVRGELDLLDGRWTHALGAQINDTSRRGFDDTGRVSGNEGQRYKATYETTLRLSGGTVRHELTFALDAERERFRNTDPSGFAFTGRRETDNVGVVGQYDLFVGERAAFGASIRRDDNDRFDDTTTYRVQGSYRFETGTRIRGAAGSGVKNPGFYELFGFVDGRFIGNRDLRPETSEGYEIGLKQAFAGGRITLGATYFDSELEDEIFTTFPPPTFVATPGNRVTRSTREGIETFLSARVGTAWRLDAAYTYLRAREDGVDEVRRPEHVASVALDWRAPQERGGLTLVARYHGETDDLAFTDPSFVPRRARLDEYLIVNVNADLAVTRSVGLFARVENLLDEPYEEVFSFRAPGRSAYAGLRARF